MLNIYLQTLKSGYWVVVRGEHDEKITDFSKDIGSDLDRNSLFGLISAIEYVRDSGDTATVYTNSEFLLRVVNEMDYWASQNWRNPDDKAIPNLNLVLSLYLLRQKHGNLFKLARIQQ